MPFLGCSTLTFLRETPEVDEKYCALMKYIIYSPQNVRNKKGLKYAPKIITYLKETIEGRSNEGGGIIPQNFLEVLFTSNFQEKRTCFANKHLDYIPLHERDRPQCSFKRSNALL